MPKPDDPVTVALAFVEAINSLDPDRVAALMTEDHEFIDSEGNRAAGRENLRDGWAGYYALFPDYNVGIERIRVMADGRVVLCGRSTGTLSDLAQETLRKPDGSPVQQGDYQGPAIWTARVRDGLLAEWRVYDDTAAVRAELRLH